MERSDYYVYGIYSPDTGLPCYFGKGSKNRLRCHLSPRNLHKAPWPLYVYLRELDSSGITPRIEVITGGLTEDEAFSEESRLIALYGRRDNRTGTLLNLTDGGEGRSGRKHSPESRAKMSAKRRLWKTTPEAIAKMKAAKRPPASEATRRLLSQKRKGVKKPPEFVAKMKARKYSPETIAKKVASAAWQSKPVESFDLKTGDVIKVYPSVSATKSDGHGFGSVSVVCSGSRKSHHGLGWRYSVDPA